LLKPDNFLYDFRHGRALNKIVLFIMFNPQHHCVITPDNPSTPVVELKYCR
jgi:hypothetical protein